MSDEADRVTRDLVERAAKTRARVAADVARLATELEPTELQDRALDAAERQVERIGFRLLRRLAGAPRWLAATARQHPAAGVAVTVGVGLLVWRIAARRRH
jgi:hypothetical protein